MPFLRIGWANRGGVGDVANCYQIVIQMCLPLSVGVCIVRVVGQAYALPERTQNDYVLQWFQPTD